MCTGPHFRRLGALLLWITLTGSTAWGQTTPLPDRARLDAEARSQAAEADRLFKSGKFNEALTFYQAEQLSRKALGDPRNEAYALRARAAVTNAWATRMPRSRPGPGRSCSTRSARTKAMKAMTGT